MLPSPTMSLLFLAFLVAAPARHVTSEPTADRAALLDFIRFVPHESRLSWNASGSACDWTGVTCDPNRTAVESLRLPGAGLVGPIPPATLGRLSSLRVLSLRSNRLSGAVPADLSNLTLLRSLYLQDNLLSGDFPFAGIAKSGRISRLDLSKNNLTGEIPFAVNNLTRLTRLFLQQNRFTGPLPSIDIPKLAEFNASFNSLNGSVPQTLARFPASSFTGNLNLCGGPLPPCTPFFPLSPASPPSETSIESKEKKKLSAGEIVAIVVGSAGLFLLLLLFLIWFLIRRRRRKRADETKAAAKGGPTSGEVPMTSSSMSKESGVIGGEGGEKNKLVFVGKGGGYSFDLEDLLRASAEVLGKGSVGTSYKAVLEEGTTVVVKRLKDVAVSRREFDSQMDALGRIQEHPNVLPLRAYYFSKDEKLLVFDFLPAGSLSALLHGSRGSGHTPLEWENRMRVALAAGRALAHLHGTAKVVHGNVKASNVLLRQDTESATLTDYGLSLLFGPAAPPSNSRVAGYRAPEVMETRRPTFKSDVYSLGVLLLELLTGKAPNQASLGGEEGVDLPRWVQSVVREEWTAEVFDVELMRYPNIEEEMVQLLQIAMACVSTVPDSRPDIHEVVRMMEEITRRNETPSLRGSSDDPSKGGSTSPVAVTP